MRMTYPLTGLLLLLTSAVHATPDATQLAVWANEAIVSTYTFDHSNFLDRQRDIARYFSAEGWTKYLSALNASGLPDSIQKNAYSVTAVALLPPAVSINSDGSKWQATMPLLVLYKNPQYQQKQTLQVVITFREAPNASQGVRGLMMDSLQAKVTNPPCECKAVAAEPKKSETPAPANATPPGTATKPQ